VSDLKFNFILTVAGANQNKQVFVEDELQYPEVFRSPIGQPIDIDHKQEFEDIRGEITGSWLVPVQEDRPLGIKCSGVIISKYDKDIAKIRMGAGKWAAVSMEALPNPLEQVGSFLIIHMPIFVGAGLVRYPGCSFAHVEEVDGKPVKEDEPIQEQQIASIRTVRKQILTAGIRLLVK